MYPTSMRINDDGRLVVNFKTEARFRGQFVMSHPGNLKTQTRVRVQIQIQTHTYLLTAPSLTLFHCVVKLFINISYSCLHCDGKLPLPIPYWQKPLLPSTGDINLSKPFAPFLLPTLSVIKKEKTIILVKKIWCSVLTRFLVNTFYSQNHFLVFKKLCIIFEETQRQLMINALLVF